MFISILHCLQCYSGTQTKRGGFSQNADIQCKNGPQMEGEAKDTNSILQDFSDLAERILSLWEGEHSLRRRIEVLAERQKAMGEGIRCAEEAQRDLRLRLGELEQHTEEQQASLDHLKKQRLYVLAQGTKVFSKNFLAARSVTCSIGPQLCDIVNNHTSSDLLLPHSVSGIPRGMKHGTNSAALVFSAGQFIAFDMLQFIHKRLTSYMWAHMCKRVRNMNTEEEKGDFLRIFRGVDGESAFGTKPLSEMTYAELLDFALKKKQVEAEVEMALQAAETQLMEEAVLAGYVGANESLCSMRNQMLVYLQYYRHFKFAAARQGILLSFNTCISQSDISRIKHAADFGFLGVLQPACQLIQLACFLLSKM